MTWAWLWPFEHNSFASSKTKEALIEDLREAVRLRRHWLLALFLGPAGQLVGEITGNRFTLTQKSSFRKNSYFPVARGVVRDAEGGSAVEIRWSCPMFYVVVIAFALFPAQSLVQNPHRDSLVIFLLPFFLFVCHAVCCLFYQKDKEEMEEQIRKIL